MVITRLERIRRREEEIRTIVSANDDTGTYDRCCREELVELWMDTFEIEEQNETREGREVGVLVLQYESRIGR